MTDWRVPETWLVVFEDDASQSRIEPNCESAIDAAVSTFLETGKDSLLHLTFIEGFEYVLLASRVTSWFVSTPEFRRRADALTEHLKDEKRENGWVDDG